jgi:hypothetical protein
MRKTIEICNKWWFILMLDRHGKIESLEMHDWRSGGAITPATGSTYEQLLEKHIKACSDGSDANKNIVYELVEAFLKDTRTQLLI